MLALLRQTSAVYRNSMGALSINERLALNGKATTSQIDDLLATRRPSLMSSDEEEKKRISRELHDGLGQLLTSINLHIQQCLTAGESQTELPQGIRDSMVAISNMARQAMGEVRTICGALRPAILDDLGVLAAISWQCRQISKGCSQMEVETNFRLDESMIPEEYKTVLYRIVQEALNNAVKYSRTNTVRVSLYLSGLSIELCIQDFGVGFDLKQVQSEHAMGGMGLVSMRERAESMGGAFKIDTAVGRGVGISVTFPLEKVALSG